MPGPEADACPQRKRHTKCPQGYIAWHAWAAKKARTHRAVKCSGCGLYAIWVPKRRRKRLRARAS